MDPDCWYINFDMGFPMQAADNVAKQLADVREPGCYKVHYQGNLNVGVEVWGGGKTAANQKRRAALKVSPRVEWVQFSRFLVRKPSGQIELVKGREG